ncbi:MAG: tetratricopeptide repeat protein [Candidatus Eremiobacteraeota bacterium]|nr:tetratricopeptide repeat protein [Candidatus Eremiobacteraeota bacterium]
MSTKYSLLFLLLFICALRIPISAAEEMKSEASPRPPHKEALEEYQKGRDLYREGKLEDAASCYLKAISLDPGFDYAYGSLGYIRYEQGNYQEAEKIYLKALELAPSDSFYHGELALVYHALGKKDKAYQECAKALELEPANYLFHYNLGMMQSLDGKKDDARASFEKALTLCKERKARKMIEEKLGGLKLRSLKAPGHWGLRIPGASSPCRAS